MQHTELSPISDNVQLLAPVKVSELIKHRKPAIFVYADTTIEEAGKDSLGYTSQVAANILKVNNILSAPVFDSKEKRFIGVIDVMSLIKYSTLGMFLQKGFIDTFSRAPVKDALLDNEEMEGSILKFVLFHEDETLSTIISTLVKGKVHRGFVRKAADAMDLYVISQSDIVRYLYINRVNIPQIFIRDWVSPTKTAIISARSDETAMSGFMKLWANKVQGLAVVDENGKLVDTLSASDVRGITSEKLQHLLLPIPLFKKSLLGTYMKPVDCGMNENLQDATKKLVDHKVHRIWAVDDGHHPVGVISLSDILDVVYHKAVPTK